MKTPAYLLLLFLSLSASGQEETRRPIGQVELGLGLQVPLQAFRTALDANQFCLNAALHFRVQKKAPILAGLIFHLIPVGVESLELQSNISGHLEEYTFRTNSNILGLGADFRILVPRFLYVDPFVDGFVGFQSFFTTTLIEDRNGDNAVKPETDSKDLSLMYGLTAGVGVPVNRHLSIIAKTSYVAGSSVTFYAKDRNHGPIQDSLEAFRKETSPVRALVPTLGVIFTLYKRDARN